MFDSPVPNTSTAAIARVRAYAAAQGWEKGRFAREAGLRDTTLRRFNDPDWNPTVETLAALEAIIPADFAPPPATPATDQPGA